MSIVPNELKQSALSDFDTLLKVELSKIDFDVQQDVQLRIGECVKAGMLRSGRSLLLVTQEYSNSIPKRSLVAIALLERTLSAHGIEINNTNKDQVILKLHQFIDDTETYLCNMARNTPPFKSQLGLGENVLQQLHAISEIEKQRIIGEINLMAAKNASKLDELSKIILLRLREEFVGSNRQSDELQNGYAGPQLNDFEQQVINETGASKVDFDLSLKAVEDGSFAKTGPMVPYDNPDNSNVIIVAIISKREYIYLTEAGYRAASALKTSSPARVHSRPTVNISGTFHQSPIGIGETVTQSLNFDVTNENQSVTYLTELLSKTGKSIDTSTSTELTQMVQSANAGDMKTAKPIFQKLFGAAEETVKQLAYGVLTAIITKQMGM